MAVHINRANRAPRDFDGIVKVQTSLADSAGRLRVLIYDETRSVYFEGDGDSLERLMLGGAKAFFRARLDADGNICLVEWAEEQDW